MVRALSENNAFTQVILQEIRKAAQEEVRRILKEAEDQAREIVKEAKQKAVAIRREQLKKALREFRIKLRRELAPKKLEIRNVFLQRRYELLSEFFDRATKEVISILRSNKELYEKFIRRSIIEIIESISSDHIILHPCSPDVELVSSIIPQIIEEYRSKGRDLRLELGDPIECSGGVVGESFDGRELFNSTLESKISQLREEIFSKILSSMLVISKRNPSLGTETHQC